jgi:hypothetical protein
MLLIIKLQHSVKSGDVTCKNITCDSIYYEYILYQPPVERIIMLNRRPTSITPGVSIMMVGASLGKEIDKI